MSTENIQRLRYYKGQALTAQDFQDEQAYHVEKLRRHIQRFPFGIIRGLEVEYNDENKTYKIRTGAAVDNQGREMLVAAEGFSVDATGFNPNQPYLTIIYEEQDACAERSICESNGKFNRKTESTKAIWEELPNSSGEKITLAFIKVVDGATVVRPDIVNGESKDALDDANRRIRLEADILNEDKVIFNPVEGHDHTGGTKGKKIPPTGIENLAVTEAILDNGAVTSAKIRMADGITGQDITSGSGVKEAHIQNQAITGDKIRIGTITGENIGVGEIKSKNIGTGEVKSTNIGTGEVKSTNIGTGEVKSTNIGTGEVKSTNIGTGEVKSTNIGTGEVKSTNIGAGEVKSTNIGTGEVKSTNIGAGEVKSTNIGTGEVKSANIGTGEIKSANIGTGEVKSANIGTGEIKSANIGTGEVKSANIGTGEVKNENLASGAVTSDKLSLIEQVQTNVTVPGPPTFFTQVKFDFESDFEKPRLAQVIPTEDGAIISFGLEIQRSAGGVMTYVVTINNRNLSPDATPVQCTARILKFN